MPTSLYAGYIAYSLYQPHLMQVMILGQARPATVPHHTAYLGETITYHRYMEHWAQRLSKCGEFSLGSWRDA